MRNIVGFVVPFGTAAAGETFAQHLIVAGVSGVFGVAGVTLAAYVTTRRSRDRIERHLRDHLDLPPAETTQGGEW